MHPAIRDAAHVAVVRALPGLGDMLCALPALRALRAALPTAHITLIGLPSAGWIIERHGDYVDELFEFPGWPGIPEVPVAAERIPSFLDKAHARRFDLALQLHGSGLNTNSFVALLGARRQAGFALRAQYRPDPELFLDWNGEEHEIRRCLRLLEHVGVPAQGEDTEFRLADRDVEALAPLGIDVTTPYGVVHAGSKLESRRWGADRFAAVADGMAARGLRVYLTGTAGEAELVADVAAAMKAPNVNVTGRTDLGALAALVDRASILVSNDTGVAHLAAAVKTPSVVIFRCSDPQRWAPLDERLHRRVGLGEPIVERYLSRPDSECCLADACAETFFDAADVPPSQVTPDDVLREVDDLLRKR